MGGRTKEEIKESARIRGQIKTNLIEIGTQTTILQVRQDWALIEQVRQLRDVHGYGQEEIATMCHIPRHYVRSLIFRFCIDR